MSNFQIDRFPRLTVFLLCWVTAYIATSALYFWWMSVAWQLPAALALARVWCSAGFREFGVPIALGGKFRPAVDIVNVMAAHPRVIKTANLLLHLFPLIAAAIAAGGMYASKRFLIERIRLVRGVRVVKHQ